MRRKYSPPPGQLSLFGPAAAVVRELPPPVEAPPQIADWLLNPANRLEYPPLPSGDCPKCGAPALMVRPVRWAGVLAKVCVRCGWSGWRRAAPGRPDECGYRNGTGPCTRLMPCPAHGAEAVA